jgi:hypothetical protein
VVGGIPLTGILGSNSTLAWPLGGCLFILAQTLYFYLIAADSGRKTINASKDPFEQARHETEKVLAQLA